MLKKSLYYEGVYLRGGPIEWDVIGGSSINIAREPVVITEKVVPEKKELQVSSVGAAATKAATAVVMFVVKYFVIVDLMINLSSKLNIILSPKIQRILEAISSAELPSFSVVESISPIRDGGVPMLEQYEE